MNGILPLWKEKGMTSHDCVNAVRRIFQMKRVGHGGTLDPEVDGMLIIAVGSATRVLEFLLEGDKTYQGQITLGQSTTTEDATGEIVKECPVAADLTEKQVDEGLAQFHGTVLQTPPLYSAVHVQGKKLYEYAHQGLKVERPQREVTIYEFVRTSSLQRTTAQKVKFDFKVRCSKGTYVRTLAVDLGRH